MRGPFRALGNLAVAMAVSCVAWGSGLPRWADKAVEESALEPAPARSEAWVLLDHTDFLYAGGGEIQVHHRLVVKVLTAEGAVWASFRLWGAGSKGYRVKKVNGWNQPPSAKVITLDREAAFTLDADPQGQLSGAFWTGITLPDVVPGSIVAFESEETLTPAQGPSEVVSCMGRDPVLRWELEADTRWYVTGGVKAALVTRNLEPLSRELEAVPGRSLRIRHLPGLEGARGLPGTFDCMPLVFLGFEDPQVPRTLEGPSDRFGTFCSHLLDPAGPCPGGIPAFQGEPSARLEALVGWMRRTFSYRAVYLEPERGWQPVPPEHTLRQHAGDCKDLAALAIAAARKAGFQAFPVLARIGDGVARRQEPVPPGLFNYVLAAIQLPEGVAFPAAVAVAGTRYLLYDPTSRFTPLGLLPDAHRGAQVLICLPGGGVWVDVPAQAVPRGRVEVALEAELGPGGALRGTLSFKDQDGLGLAGIAARGGLPALRSFLGDYLKLDAVSEVTILKAGDPLAPGPFEVSARVALADIRASRGDRVVLDLPGLPSVPGPIQRFGTPRHLGVEAGEDCTWRWRAKLKLPPGWTLVHEGLDQATALRTLHWSGRAGPGPTLSLALDMEEKARTWERSEAAEGVATVDEDRHALARFLASALAFRGSA